MVQLISLSNEFCVKVGREIDFQEKSFAVWMFMDDDTKSRAEKKELVEGASTFAKVCDSLEILTNEGENRRAIAEYAKLQAPVRMDLSALQAKDGAAQHDEHAAAAAAAPEAPEPAAAGDAHLDAFGNPQKVINVKEKDTGKLIAHHALELNFSVISVELVVSLQSMMHVQTQLNLLL